MLRSKQLALHNDRKSSIKHDIVHDKQKSARNIRRERPVANVVQVLYCRTYRSDSTSSSISSISSISPINAISPSSQTTPKLNRILPNKMKGDRTENHDLVPLRECKNSNWGETKPSIVKSSFLDATSNDILRAEFARSSTQVSGCISNVSNGDDSMVMSHIKKEIKYLSNNTAKGGRKDGRGLLGAFFDITSQGT